MCTDGTRTDRNPQPSGLDDLFTEEALASLGIYPSPERPPPSFPPPGPGLPDVPYDPYYGDGNANPRLNRAYQTAKSHIRHGLPVIPAWDGRRRQRRSVEAEDDDSDGDEVTEPSSIVPWKRPSRRLNKHGTLSLDTARAWFCGRKSKRPRPTLQRWRWDQATGQMVRIREDAAQGLLEVRLQKYDEVERDHRNGERVLPWLLFSVLYYAPKSTDAPCGIIVPPYVAVVDVDCSGPTVDDWLRDNLPPTLTGCSYNGRPHLYYLTRQRIGYRLRLDASGVTPFAAEALGEGHYVLEMDPLEGAEMSYLPERIEELALRRDQTPITMPQWFEQGDRRRKPLPAPSPPPSGMVSTGKAWRRTTVSAALPDERTAPERAATSWEQRLQDRLASPPEDGNTRAVMNDLTLPALSLWGEIEGLLRLERWLSTGSSAKVTERTQTLRSLYGATVARWRSGKLRLLERTFLPNPLTVAQGMRLGRLLRVSGLWRRADTRGVYLRIAAMLLETFQGDEMGVHWRDQQLLAEATGLEQHTVSEHVGRLTEGRKACRLPLFILDERGARGRCNRYRLTDLGKWVLQGGAAPGQGGQLMARLSDGEAEAQVCCVLYLRVSHEDQAKRALSIPKQREALQHYAQSCGYTVVGEYKDLAKSAFEDRHRPGFEEMLAEACKGQPDEASRDRRNRTFDLILVYDSSRFARHSSSASRDKDQLLRWGVRVEYPGMALDREQPEGRFTDTVFEAQDEYLSRKLRKHAIESISDFVGKGLVPGGRSPYGYALEMHRRVVVSSEAEVIRLMVDWKLDEGLGCPAIARRLNEHGHRTRDGNPWSESSVHNLLTNPCLYGDLVFRVPDGTGRRHVEFIPDAHEALITREEGQRLGLRLRQVCYDSRKPHLDESRASPVTRNQKHVLSGLFHCLTCGQHYVDRSPSKKNYFYYYCRNRECKVRRFRSDQVEASVFEVVLRHVLRAKVMSEPWEVQRHELDDGLRSGRQTAIEGEIDALNAKIAALVDQVEERNSSPSLMQRPREREAERRQRQGELERLKAAAEGAGSDTPFGAGMDLVADWCQAVKAVLEESAWLRHTFVRRVVKRIDVPAEGPLVIHYHSVVPVPADSAEAPPEAREWEPVFQRGNPPKSAMVVERVRVDGGVERLDETRLWLRD